MSLPKPRGPISEHLLHALAGAPGAIEALPEASGAAEADEDLQLALYCCYELHYRGLPGVDERWEWEPSLIAVRRALEAPFEAAVERLAGPADGESAPEELDLALRALADADEAPSL